MTIDFNLVLEQAKQLKNDFAKKQDELAKKEFNASSGGGLVTVTIDGVGKALNVNIDPKTFKEEDPKIIEDLIVAAFNSAKDNLDNESKKLTSNIPGAGLDIPGLDKILGS